MSTYFNRPLLFSFFISFAFLQLVLFPCSCLSQENANQTTTTKAHDCCEKGAKNTNKNNKKCVACDIRVLAKDSSEKLNVTVSLSDIFLQPLLCVYQKTFITFPDKSINIPVSLVSTKNSITSSSTLSILLNRWLI